jgi:hypothetical protein
MPRAAGGNPAGLLRSCEGPLVVWAPPPQHPRGAAAMQPCWFRSLFVLVRRSSSLSRPKMWTEPACRRTIPRRERHRVLPIALSPLQEGRCYPSPAYRRNGRPEKGRGVRQGQVMAEMASAGFQTHKKHRFFLCARQGHRLCGFILMTNLVQNYTCNCIYLGIKVSIEVENPASPSNIL